VGGGREQVGAGGSEGRGGVAEGWGEGAVSLREIGVR